MLALGAVVTLVGLTACAGDDDDDAATATDQELSAEAPAATIRPGDGGDAGFGVAGEAPADEATAPSPSGGTGGDVTTLQPAGQQLAIAAHATMQTDDVRAAVERITTTVASRGGRIASADIDYAAPADPDEPDDAGSSRATLVVAIPPGELSAVRGVLDDAGDVLSYDQLAEDVTDQLADLETRIDNQRASIERIRELYAGAVDVDAIVRIEAELTNRETVLEQLLATQQNVTDRVATSTLTIDISTSPAAVEPVDDDAGSGLGDALAGGWSAFAGGVFAIVLGLAAALPFLLTVLAAAFVVLWVRSLARRRTTRAPLPAPDVTTEREPVSASRPE